MSNPESENNPYRPPSSEIEVITNREEGQLDFKSAKKIYQRSSNINALNFLIMLGLIIICVAIGPILSEPDSAGIGIFLLLISALYVAGTIGLWTRAAWGRIVGMIICCIFMINVPIGTIIGIFCLIALAKSPDLFGANRITHQEIKANYKEAKLQRKGR